MAAWVDGPCAFIFIFIYSLKLNVFQGHITGIRTKSPFYTYHPHFSRAFISSSFKTVFFMENRECSILSKGMCALYIFLQGSTVLFTNFCYQLLCRCGKKELKPLSLITASWSGLRYRGFSYLINLCLVLW